MHAVSHEIIMSDVSWRRSLATRGNAATTLELGGVRSRRRLEAGVGEPLCRHHKPTQATTTYNYKCTNSRCP
jgi:hypothetical protein